MFNVHAFALLNIHIITRGRDMLLRVKGWKHSGQSHDCAVFIAMTLKTDCHYCYALQGTEKNFKENHISAITITTIMGP